MGPINFAEPDIRADDILALASLLDSTTTLTNGVQCRAFENDFCRYTGVNCSLAVSSCMSASRPRADEHLRGGELCSGRWR